MRPGASRLIRAGKIALPAAPTRVAVDEALSTSDRLGFTVYLAQINYSLLARDAEHELVPPASIRRALA